MDLYIYFREVYFEADTSNGRECTSQTVSGRQNAGLRVLFEDTIDVCVYLFLDSEVVDIEPGMDGAAVAVRVLNLLKVGIFNPVLPVMSASKSHHNLFSRGSVPDVTMHL